MKRTGEMLRKAREERGISQTEVALSLKINNKVIAAIEAGDLAKLPAKTFLRGFVQSYAQALKINVDEVMAVFGEEMGTSRAQATTQAEGPVGENDVAQPNVNTPSPVMTIPKREKGLSASSDSPLDSIEEPHRARSLILLGVSVVLVVLIFATKKMIEKYQRESEPAQVNVSAPLPTLAQGEPTTMPGLSTNPSSNEKSSANSSGPMTSATPTTMATTTMPATTTTVKVTTTTVKVTTTTEKPTTTTMKPTTTTTLPPTTTTAKAAAAAAAVTATTAAPAKTGKSIEMIIEALDAVDLEYSTKSGSPQKMHLNAEQVHTIRSSNGLKLNVSNGGAVNLILNGKDLGVPGDLGKPIKLSY